MIDYDNGEYIKQLKEAELYFNMGRYEQALKCVDQILAYNPEEACLLYFRAKILYCQSSYDEAEAYCRLAITAGYPAGKCFYLLGNIYCNTDRNSEAENCFLESLRENPEQADVMAAYGYLMLKTGHDKKAGKLMKEALGLDPLNETVLHYSFLFNLAKNKGQEQVLVLEKYMEVCDSEVEKLLKIGIMETARENYKAARECFKEAFILDPANEDILTILKTAEADSHLFFLPQKYMRKTGGPAVVWLFFTALFFGLRFINENAATVILVIYLILFLYTWIAAIIYRIVTKNL